MDTPQVTGTPLIANDVSPTSPDSADGDSGVRRRRSKPTVRDLFAVAVVALIAGAAAVAASSAPTGTDWLDACERALLAVGIVLAGSRARRWTLVLASTIVAVAGAGWATVVGAVGLLFMAVLAVTDRRDRALSAAAAGCVSYAALRLEVPGPFGLESIIAAVAILPILRSGYRVASRRVRRAVRRGAAAFIVLSFLAVGGALAAGVRAADDVQWANSAMRRANDATNAGDRDGAVDLFAAAKDRLASANGLLGAWYAQGARVLPVAGANYRAVDESVAVAEDLADLGTTLASEVDFDTIRRVDGGIDVDVLRSLDAPVADAAFRLRRAGDALDDVDSGFLLAPLDSRLADARVDVADLNEEIDTAEMGIADGPAMLGAETPRRYLLLLGSSAELRALGGHIGNWAELVIDDGRIELVDVGGPRDLSRDAEDSTVDLSSFPEPVLSMQPERYPQNWGTSPDMPTVARLSALLFEQSTGRAVDGVVYADPAAFAGLLTLTGPLAVNLLSEPFAVDSENAVQFLTRDQYSVFADDNVAALAIQDLVQRLFESLTSRQLPGPRSLADRFSPLVRAGSLQMASIHRSDDRLLDRLGMLGAVTRPPGGDLIAVLNQNAGPNKTDAYLRRTSDIDIAWDPTSGAVRSSVTVTLTNEAPADGLSRSAFGNSSGLPEGTNLTDLIIMSPFRHIMTTIDDVQVATQPFLDESGLWTHAVRVILPPGKGRRVRVELGGEVEPGPRYRLAVVGQPLLNEGELSVSLKPTVGVLDGPGVREAGPASITMDNHTDRLVQWTASAE